MNAMAAMPSLRYTPKPFGSEIADILLEALPRLHFNGEEAVAVLLELPS